MVSAVFYAAAAIVAVIMIACEVYSRIGRKKEPGLEYNDVLVIDKRISVREGKPHYFITFLRKDGVKREFEVDSVRYSEIEEGEEGELCLEDETFKEE
ncbi:MAG: hypothetical protein IJO47_04705 [Clostridia bacterium]|nr:hypothetical protein [Clostridia bacterium]